MTHHRGSLLFPTHVITLFPMVGLTPRLYRFTVLNWSEVEGWNRSETVPGGSCRTGVGRCEDPSWRDFPFDSVQSPTRGVFLWDSLPKHTFTKYSLIRVLCGPSAHRLASSLRRTRSPLSFVSGCLSLDPNRGHFQCGNW